MRKEKRFEFLQGRAGMVTLLFCLLVSFCVKAEVKTFQCGDNCTATLDENGVMRVSGTGTMWGYNSEERYHTPWFGEYINKVVVEDGITNVGQYAFFACGHINSIELAQSVAVVDVGAFDEDSNVQHVSMYDSTLWRDQDDFNDYNDSIVVQISCYGDMDKCKTNFLNSPKLQRSSFAIKGKRIYTVDEATRLSKPDGNTFKLRYK